MQQLRNIAKPIQLLLIPLLTIFWYTTPPEGKTEELDIESLAKEAGVNIDLAKEVIRSIMKKVNKK